MDTDLKIESGVFSSGAFSVCLVRVISPSSASILFQSRTGGQPGILNSIHIFWTTLKVTWNYDCV